MNIKNIALVLIALGTSTNLFAAVEKKRPRRVEHEKKELSDSDSDSSSDSEHPAYVRVEEKGATFYVSHQDEQNQANGSLIGQGEDGKYYLYTLLSEEELEKKFSILPEQELEEIEAKKQNLHGQEAFLFEMNLRFTKENVPADFAAFLEQDKIAEKEKEEVIKQIPDVVAAVKALKIKKEITREFITIKDNLLHLKREQEALANFPLVRELCIHEQREYDRIAEEYKTTKPSEFAKWNNDFEADSKPHSADEENRLRRQANNSKKPDKQEEIEELQAEQKNLQALLNINDAAKLEEGFKAFKDRKEENEENEEKRHAAWLAKRNSGEVDISFMPKYKFISFDDNGEYVYETPVLLADKTNWAYKRIAKIPQGNYRLDNWNWETNTLEDLDSPTLIPTADFFEFDLQIREGDRRIAEITAAAQKVNEQHQALFKLREKKEGQQGFDRISMHEELKELELELEFAKLELPKIPLLEAWEQWEADFNADKVAHDARTENRLREEANELNSRKVQKQKQARYNLLVEQYNAVMQEAGLEDELLEARDFKAEKQAAITAKEQEALAIEQAAAAVQQAANQAAAVAAKPNKNDPQGPKEFKDAWINKNRKKVLGFFTLPLIAAEAAYEYDKYKKALPMGKKAMTIQSFCWNELLKQPTKYKLFTATFYAVTGLNIALAVYDWKYN